MAPTQLEQRMGMSIDSSRFSRNTLKPQPKYYSGVVPLALGASTGVALLKGARSSVARYLGNPFAGQTFKAGAKSLFGRIGGRLAGVALRYQAFQLARTGVTGESYELLPNFKKSLGFAINPVTGLFGLAVGEGEKFYSQNKQRIQNMSLNVPGVNPSNYLNIPSPTNIFNFPKETGGANFSLAPPSMSYAAPSISISGGGGGGIPPELLLALLGAGVGGYLIGRKRKKKKKKSKKRRS